MCVDVSLEGETRSGLISLLKGWCTNDQQIAQKLSGAVHCLRLAQCGVTQFCQLQVGGSILLASVTSIAIANSRSVKGFIT